MLSVEQVINRSWPWSIWLTLLFGLAIAAIVAALYFTERGRASGLGRGMLIAIRTSIFLLVLWMLAGWNVQRYQSDMPELIIVMDESGSMQTRDSSEPKSAANAAGRSRWEIARQALSHAWSSSTTAVRQQYRPRLYAIADDARQIALDEGNPADALGDIAPSGLQSRLGDALTKIVQRQAGRPTAAILLMSDGIVTGGSPLTESAAAARRLSIPVYCIATGQQLPQPDLALSDLLADDAVYLGDRVNIQATLTATDLAAHRAVVHLRDMQSGQVVDSAPVELSSDRGTATVQLSFVPKAAGNWLVKLEVAPAPGEKNLDNNSIERVIDVRDQTLRVLLVQKTPGFEYRFLKTLLERTSNQADPDRRAFELDVVLQDADASHVAQDAHALRLVPGDKETIELYNVIILGQIDPALIAASTQQLIVDQVTAAGCGLMFICQPEFDPAELAAWPLGKLLPIDLNAPRDANPAVDASQWSFDGTPRRWQPTSMGQSALPLQLADGSSAAALWRSLPGPDWYYMPGPLKPGAQVLATATQDVGSSVTSSSGSPLLVSQFVGAGRVVMQTNDETYRWIGFQGSELIYERYWNQMLRWLARGKLNRQEQTELTVEPRRSQVGQPVEFQVRLSPEAALAMRDQECEVLLERMGGESKSLPLKRTQSASAEFKASDATLPAGSYRASLVRPQEPGVSSVTFSVTSPPGELANLRSDWQAMQSLAQQTHGRFFTAEQAGEVFRSMPKGTPVRRGTLPPIPLWNAAWVAALFVLLLTVEWIARRSLNMF